MDGYIVVTPNFCWNVKIRPQTAAAAISVTTKIRGSMTVTQRIQLASGEHEGEKERLQNEGR